jgi:hypothetical protein
MVHDIGLFTPFAARAGYGIDRKALKQEIKILEIVTIDRAHKL